MTKGHHVVKPVGELDDHHSEVFGHCEEHLAQSFRHSGSFGGSSLTSCEVSRTNNLKLRHPLNEGSYILPKTFHQTVSRDRIRVF